ncbi:putative rz gp24 [Burkholderia cenocepacia]|uniref:Rz gp24 n=1 Tax=Burkholderia cenocepacia TaxID=95486 RepID=A0AAN0RT28_9BURK|nr:putative rz gp24 [Burkholderia cenocepacia]
MPISLTQSKRRRDEFVNSSSSVMRVTGLRANNKGTPKMLQKNVTWRALMLPPLLLLLTACASRSPSLSPERAIPPLRPEARQPATPSICLPTCSDGLTKLRENWRESLTSGELPVSSARPITAP